MSEMDGYDVSPVYAARLVVAAHPDKWKQAFGNANLLGWFVGRAMRLTGGKHPSEVMEELSRIRILNASQDESAAS